MKVKNTQNGLFFIYAAVMWAQEPLGITIYIYISHIPFAFSLQNQEIIPDYMTDHQPNIRFRKQTKISSG